MADSTTAQSGTSLSTTTTVGSASSAIGTGSLYAGNAVAIVHWVFACVAQGRLVEPDEVTAVLLAGALTHISTIIKGWFAKRPKLAKAADVAKAVALELGKPETVAMIEKVAAGGSLTLGDKVGAGEQLLDLTNKVQAILDHPALSSPPIVIPPAAAQAPAPHGR